MPRIVRARMTGANAEKGRRTICQPAAGRGAGGRQAGGYAISTLRCKLPWCGAAPRLLRHAAGRRGARPPARTLRGVKASGIPHSVPARLGADDQLVAQTVALMNGGGGRRTGLSRCTRCGATWRRGPCPLPTSALPQASGSNQPSPSPAAPGPRRQTGPGAARCCGTCTGRAHGRRWMRAFRTCKAGLAPSKHVQPQAHRTLAKPPLLAVVTVPSNTPAGPPCSPAPAGRVGRVGG